jgi:antitoxin YefM
MAALIPGAQLQYVTDENGTPVSVIVPIDLWTKVEHELRSERETTYLLSTDTMRKRLLAAKERSGGYSLEDVHARLGI